MYYETWILIVVFINRYFENAENLVKLRNVLMTYVMYTKPACDVHCTSMCMDCTSMCMQCFCEQLVGKRKIVAAKL